MRKVEVLTHPRSREAAEVAEKVEKTLRSAGVDTRRTHRQHGRDADLLPGTELLVAIGGDGTVLRAQRLAVRAEIPVLGVGAGRLGFLAETVPEDLDAALAQLLRGEFREELRSLIGFTHHRHSGQVESHTALNDVVLARGRNPRSLWIDVKVDGASMAHYVADGVIAATPTGSTAYALAAGGPILSPELPAIVLTPIAAHLSIVHSVVIAEGSCIELALLRPQDAALSVDGQVDLQVGYGDRLVITTSEQRARFLRLTPPNQFYAKLVPRLQHNLSRTRPAPEHEVRGSGQE